VATLLQFSRNIRRRGRQTVNSASRITRSAAKAALKAAIEATPVDTGEARSNWRVGAGAPPTAIIPPYSAYPKGSKANGAGRSERANAAAAYAAGRAKIDLIKGVPGVGLKTAIYVVNNSRQIGPLNSGRSSQAPGGFIEAATAEARLTVATSRIFTR